MSNEKVFSGEAAVAYVQALKDAGVYDPDEETSLEKASNIVIDKEEAKPGVWLFRVYKDWGTDRCKERARVVVESGDATISILGPPHYVLGAMSAEKFVELVGAIESQ